MYNTGITGMQIYYYFVCRRKLWYFSNELSFESDNEDVKIGKIVDETTYKSRKKHILIDDTINIDYISEHRMLHEVKKSKKIEEAGIWQLKYYLYYLKQKGVTGLQGRIDYPLLKQSVEVELKTDDILTLEKVILDIKNITQSELPPQSIDKSFCKSCAYYDFCKI